MIAPSRRTLLAGLAASGLTLALPRPAAAAVAEPALDDIVAADVGPVF